MCSSRRKIEENNKKNPVNDDGFNSWGGYMNAKRAKLLEQFHEDKTVEKISTIFANIRILVNGLTNPPASELKTLMAAHGGEYHMYQSSNTTHIIASNLPNVKIKHLGAVPVVKPAWITESVALNKLLDYRSYLLYTNQSRLQPALNFPVVTKNSPLKTVDSTSHNIQKVTKTASDPKFLEEFYNNSRLHLIATLGAEFKQLVANLREKSNGIFPGREKLKAQRVNYCNKAELPELSTIVMHIDMDCFFVSVGLKNHPELKGLPVAITHAKNGIIHSNNDTSRQAIREQEFALYEERLPEGAASRVVDITERIDGLASMSEIASCSYEARKCGIKNGMFLGQAVKLCPELKTLPYDFEGYKEVSNNLYNTIALYTLDIEAVSCDEMYVNVKEILRESGMDVEEWANYIRNEIMNITGCPCSTGFGANRLQARLATRKAKPAGQYFIKPADVEDYMSEIALENLPGVGRATITKLRHLGLNSCSDVVKNGSLKLLQSELGNKLGERIWEQSHGRDNKPLDFHHERKSVSAEINYGIRFKTKDECYNFLESLSKEVFNRLAEINMKSRGLTLKLLVRAEGAPVETAKFLGHGVCDSITKSSNSNLIFSNAELIYKESKAIYDKLNVPFEELRGVGIQLGKLEKIAPINKAFSNFLKQSNNNNNIIRNDTHLVKKPEFKIPEAEAVMKNNNSGNKKSNLSKSKATKGKQKSKKSTSTATLKSFLSKSTTNSQSFKKDVVEVQFKSEIDLNVLNELPEEIRNEIIKEYQINTSTTVAVKPLECSKVKDKELEGQQKKNVTSQAKKTPFGNKSWNEVKESIKIWIKSTNEPAAIDVEMLGDYLRNLALHRHIEVLQIAFNFLHRNLTNLNCSWHRAYFKLVDTGQQGVLTVYGKILHISELNFLCCTSVLKDKS